MSGSLLWFLDKSGPTVLLMYQSIEHGDKQHPIETKKRSGCKCKIWPGEIPTKATTASHSPRFDCLRREHWRKMCKLDMNDQK